MGLTITKQSKVEEYYALDHLNQSSLKDLLKGIDYFLNNEKNKTKLFYEEKKNFIIGSAVDTILTGEKGEFEKQYYVSKIDNKLSEVETSIVHKVFDWVFEEDREYDNLEFSSFTGFIQASIEEHNWQPKWKMQTKINKIIEIAREYFDDLVKSKGKQILSKNEKKTIDDVVTSLTTNNITKEYFDRNNLEKEKNIDVFYQLPIQFMYEGIICKSLIDILVVFKNPITTRIESIQPIELKTMSGSTLNFDINFRKFRYDIQAAFYNLALEKHFEIEKPTRRGYKQIVVKPFKFIVESTSNVGNPIIYELTEELMNIGRFGKELPFSKSIKGFEQLFDDYSYYFRRGFKNEERIVKENNGILKLDWYGIKN